MAGDLPVARRFVPQQRHDPFAFGLVGLLDEQRPQFRRHRLGAGIIRRFLRRRGRGLTESRRRGACLFRRHAHRGEQGGCQGDRTAGGVGGAAFEQRRDPRAFSGFQIGTAVRLAEQVVVEGAALVVDIRLAYLGDLRGGPVVQRGHGLLDIDLARKVRRFGTQSRQLNG